MIKELPKDPRRIAFWAGDLKLRDILYISALFNYAAEIYPCTRIDLIAPGFVLDFFYNDDSIDQMIDYTSDEFYANNRSYARQFSKRLISQKYDMMYFISKEANHIYSAKKAGIPYLIGIKSGIGSSGLTTVIPNIEISEEDGNHQVDKILNLMSFSDDLPVNRKISISYDPKNLTNLNELLKEKRIPVKKPRIIVSPGNNKEGYNKFPDWFPETVNKVQKKIKDSIVLVVGNDQDLNLCKKFTEQYKGKIYNICGMTDDKMLTSIVSSAKIVLGVDSVTMLLADSIGIPFAALYGYRDPLFCGPINKTGNSLYIKNWEKRFNNPKEAQKFFDIIKSALKKSKKDSERKNKKSATSKTSKTKRK